MAIHVKPITALNHAWLSELCAATEDAIADGIGFNWLTPPMRETLEAYWRGVLVIPERILFGGWLDGTLASSIQLIKPPPSKETSAFAANIDGHFVAPWARGHGLAKKLLQEAEREAAKLGYQILRLSVRGTQDAAINLYEESGFVCWGVLPQHEYVGGQMIAGHYFYKHLEPLSSVE